MRSYTHPSSIITEFYNGSAWVDISSYVVSDIEAEGGFATSNPDDFTASLGMSRFDLDNSAELFTVYGGDSVRGFNTLTGWRRGARVRHRVIYEGHDKDVWFGFVREVISDDGTFGDQRVHVTCFDWIDVATNFPMKRSQILTNSTLADGVQGVVDRTSVQPEDVDADTSTFAFPTVFDNVRSKTKAIGEIDKLARSELGRVYVLKDGVLKVEGFTTRKGTNPLAQVPVVPGNALLVSADNALLVSNDNALLVNEIADASIIASEELDLRMSDEAWNDAFVRSYPTRTDTSLQVVFQIGTAIPVAGGRTLEFVGNYVDPLGGSAINATNLQMPSGTVDYLMNSAADGSGTNLTSFLTVSADYYGDVVVYRLTSSAPQLGYIIRLQARGFGIYRTSSVESHVSITGSVTAYGETTFDLNQNYQTEPYAGLVYSKSVLELYATPKTRIASVRFNANLNPYHMMAFLYLDIGSLIEVYDDRSEMFKWYHITSRKFTIFLGGMIVMLFGLYECPSISSGGLNPVGVDFDRATGDAVNFGYLPHVSDVPQRTMSAWIRLKSPVTGGSSNVISGLFVESGGDATFYMAVSAINAFRVGQGYDVSRGFWQTANDSITTGTWQHVAFSIDASNFANSPSLYINGVPVSYSVAQSPSGTIASEAGYPFVVGNVKTPTRDYIDGFNGEIKDVRVYNRVLSDAEILRMYNAGTQDYSLVTDGLVFQAFAINSDLGDTSSLNGQQIPTGNNYFDNVLRMVGEPHGTPLISQ